MPATRRFTWQFWAALSAAAAACVLPLPPPAGAPTPPFPFSSGAYVSAYRGASADHTLFRTGMLGFGRRLRDSDTLVLGNSHAQLGISAAQLGGRAFNASVAFGEGIAFFRDIVEHNGVQGKTLLVDAYNWREDGVSEIAAAARGDDAAQAYARVGRLWGRAVSDWLLDGFVPCVDTSGFELRFVRCLDWLMLRRRDNGDLHEWWSPELGPLYRDVPPALTRAYAPGPGRAEPGSYSAQFSRAFPPAFLAQRNLKPVFTLVPFPAANPARAAAEAGKLGAPFIPIAHEGLEFTADRHHLSAQGRAQATRLLLREAKARGIALH